jgi:bifunctional DNA-binding transcriptional regulator/antitoxin component of YhaV-PrlF toxin-antitoxin module
LEPKESLVLTSKLAKAHSESDSLRTTVPEEVVHELGLKVGDVVEWKELRVDGKEGAFIRKLN